MDGDTRLFILDKDIYLVVVLACQLDNRIALLNYWLPIYMRFVSLFKDPLQAFTLIFTTIYLAALHPPAEMIL